MRSPLLTLAIFTIITQCILNCGALASRSPGETSPIRVEIATGGSANITCHMNLQRFDGLDSASLYFVEEDTGRQVPRTDIAIVNRTAVVYMLRNAPTQNRDYVCKSGPNGIAVTHVSVGSPPLDVNDFKCRGFDYTFMVCNFTIPKNTILTQYNLTYTAQSPYRMYSVQKNGTRAYRTIYSQNYLQVCQLELQSAQAICNLTLDNNNYRSNYEFYNFTLTSHNVLDTNRQNFWINHYESVIPPRPVINFEQITTDSVVLLWHMPKYSYYNSKGLLYEIRLRAENFDWVNHSNYEIRNNKSEYKLKLRNLPYAYYRYTVSVRMRVRSDHDDGTMWSEPFVQSFQTQPCLPEEPPRTDDGSFYIDSTETRVRLYWQQLPVYRQNGANFRYVVTQVKRNGAVTNLNASEIDLISATYAWHKKNRYEFTIKSRNDEGESLESSRIIVPALATKAKALEKRSPLWIRNVYHASNSTYTLSWNSPLDVDNLVDYTVFWCRSKREIANECQDTVHFKHISKDATKFSTEPHQQEHTLNLAVSANYRDFNTGMHWTVCTANVETEPVKLEPEITATSARSINVQWSLDRVCTSLLEGYNLTYCLVEDTYLSLNATIETTKCSDENTKTITVEKTAKKYLLDNLEPYSMYKIEMYMFSKLKVGKLSDAQLIKTKEAAPTPARNLKVRNITSNSAWISWLPPTQANGNLRFYTIVQNNEHHIVNCSDGFCSSDASTEMTFKLENLSSFTNYKVWIISNTIEASNSNDIHFKTLIGIPSNPRNMEPTDSNNTIMQWSKPDVPSGRVEFYEVSVIVWHKDQMLRERISNVVGSTACMIHIPLCIDKDYKHTLQVRAVNVAARATEIDYHVFAANSNSNNNNNNSSTEEQDDAVGVGDSYAANSAALYDGNDELKCVGTALTEAEQAEAVARYRDAKQYVQYHSVWEKGPIYGCAATHKLSHVTMMALLVVVSSVAVMATFYVARNKIIKMSDIKCKLPGELDASSLGPFSTKGDRDGVVVSTDDFLRRSKESLYNNESHGLLSSSSSVGNDSGYMCGGKGVTGLIGATPCSIGQSSGYVGSVRSEIDYTTMHSQTTSMPQTAQQNSNLPPMTSSADDAYMAMEALQPQSARKIDDDANGNRNANAMSIINSDSGYVNPTIGAANSLMAPLQLANLPIIPSENGYIKPNKLFAWELSGLQSTMNSHPSAINVGSNFVGGSEGGGNGYVQPKMLQKPTIQPSYDGYTTLDALVKPAGMDAASTTSPLHTFVGGLPPISGYVTQKELSAFGQQQHMS